MGGGGKEGGETKKETFSGFVNDFIKYSTFESQFSMIFTIVSQLIHYAFTNVQEINMTVFLRHDLREATRILKSIVFHEFFPLHSPPPPPPPRSS